MSELKKINARIKILLNKEKFAKQNNKQFTGFPELTELKSKKAEIISNAVSLIEKKRLGEIVIFLSEFCDSLLDLYYKLISEVEEVRTISDYLVYGVGGG